MSIYNEIDRLELAKQNLKLKLESKGVTVPANARISDYASLINLLPEIKESEFINRIVDNGNSGTGKAKIYNIKGKSLVWNQLAKRSFSSSVQNGVTISADVNNNTITFIGTPSSYSINGSILSSFIVGHKYFYSHKIISNPNNLTINIGFANQGNIAQSTNADFHVIFEAGATGSGWGYVGSAKDSAFDGIKVCINVYDLTLMFGVGNEPTVEEFKSLFPLPYYSYNPGALINNDAEAIESIGFNQWDEEWELGGIDDNGINTANNDRIRSKNYISVFPNTSYYLKSTSGTPIYFYDTNKVFISKTGGTYNATFSTPLNCAYIRFRTTSVYGTTYNNDICINISNPAKNGTYEPYKKVICNLGLNSFRVKDSEDNIITVNGLKSAGNVYDEIVGNKYIKRIEEVDLGTLNWSISSPGTQNERFYASFYNIKQYTSDVKANILCIPYLTATANDVYLHTKDKTIGSSSGRSIIIYDTSYSDVVTFKTAMSGVILYYELATPIEYELVDEINTIYDVDKDGVERIVSPAHTDGSPSTPFRASIGYPVNQEQ